MKIVTSFIVFVSSVVATPDPLANCSSIRINGENHYNCRLENINDFDESTGLRLLFSHQFEYNNDNVTSIDAQDQTTSYFPIDLFNFFKNLQRLKLKNFKIKEMDDPFFNCDSLYFLSLRVNQLQIIKKGIFSSCKKLREIHLLFNMITEIHEDALAGLTELQILVIQSNQITTLSENLFRDNHKLLLINFARNHLSQFPRKLFSNLTKLEEFYGDQNKYKSLPTNSGAFIHCSSLKSFMLFETLITRLESGVFEGLKAVELVFIYGSLIEFIESNVFVGMNELKILRLENNKLLSLNSKSFSSAPSLESFYVHNNPINAISYGFFNLFSNLSFFQAENLGCINDTLTNFTPLVLQQIECFADIIYCDNNENVCNLGNLNIDDSYRDKRIFIEQLDKNFTVTHLSMSENTNMSFISNGILDSFPSLKFVNMSGVGLQNISALKLCEGCKNIETMILDNNEIMSGLKMDFTKFPKLTELSIQNSKLKSFVSLWINSNTIKSINLSRNEISSVNFTDDNLKKLEILDLTENDIITLQGFSFVNQSSIRELYLDRNLIVILFENSFLGLQKLEILSITHNKLKILERNAFFQLNFLKQLLLDYNNLQSLSTEEFGGKLPQTLEKFSANHNNLLGISKHLVESLPSGINFNVTRNPCANSLSYTSCTENSEIICNFVYENQIYFCKLESAKVVGSNYHYSITGQHKGSSNNSYVRGFVASETNNLNKPENHLYLKHNLKEVNNEFPNLSVLYYDGMGLEYLNDFSNCSELKLVSLERNRLYTLSKSIFERCTLLEYISFESNIIYSLGDGIIKNLHNLLYFNFGDNEMKKIAIDFFENAENLEVLKFHNNLITSLSENIFLRLEKLKNLTIRGNQIENLNSNLMIRLKNLENIEMQNLNLTNLIPNNFFTNSKKLISISINTNNIYRIDRKLLEFQEKLIILDFSYCKIAKIDEEAFENLKNLKVLRLQGNQIKEIPDNLFKNLCNLEVLSLHLNKFNKINENTFHTLKYLKILRIDGNEIENFDEILLKHADYLEDLDLSSNNISLLNGLTFENLKKLKTLKIDFNSIITVDERTFKNLTSLEKLSIRGNKIDKLHTCMFNNSIRLTTIDFSMNQLVTINSEIFNHEYCTSFGNLSLNFEYNLIKNIEPGAFQSLINLKNLILRNNSLTTLTTNMFVDPTLDVQRNMITIDISNNLVNRISSDFFKKISILNFDAFNNICLNNSFKYLSNLNMPKEFEVCRAIILTCLNPEINIDNHCCEIKHVEISDDDAKFEIDVTVNKISSVDVKNVTISSSNISFIPSVVFEKFQNLEALVARNIYLKKIEKIEKCNNLRILVLDSNYNLCLGSKSLQNCSNLKIISINKINLINLNPLAFYGLDNMEELHMENSKMVLLTDSLPISLKILRMSKNNLKIEQNTFETLVNLEELFIDDSRNDFHKNSLYSLQNLKILNISKRNITNFNFPVFRDTNQLEILIANESEIERLEEETLNNLNNLTELHLCNNIISIIKPTAFKNCCEKLKHLNLENDLRNGRIGFLQSNTFDTLDNLETLHLGGHQITTISSNIFGALKSLKILSLKNNKITSIENQSFSNLFKLEVLDLSHNEPLKTLSPEIFINLKAIKFLNLKNCQLKQLPSSIVYLRTLRILDISQNHLNWLLFASTYSFLEFIDFSSSQILAINPKFLDEISKNATIRSSTLKCGSLNDCVHAFDNLQFCEIVIDKKYGFSCKIEKDYSIKYSLYKKHSVKYLHNKNTPIKHQIFELFEVYDNVSKIEFWNSSITDINGIKSCNSLQYFDLRANKIERLYENGFNECVHLEILILFKNCIQIIDEKSFSNLKSLKFLDLSQNRIEILFNGTFEKNVNLEKLYLSFNRISLISSNLFSNLVNLRVLKLNANSLTQINDVKIFKNLKLLLELYLNHNQIAYINEEALNSLEKLKYLNIERNQITEVDLNKLSLKFLEYFDISSNRISTIHGNFNNLPFLRKFIAANNLCIDKNFATNTEELNEQILSFCKSKIKLEL